MDLKDLLTKVNVGEETVFDVAEGAGGKRLAIEVRQLLPEAPREPRRAESPARRHVFFDGAGFASYLAKYGGDRTVIFADPSRGEMSAIIDERTATGYEVVTMRPAPHPLFAPWAEIVGKRVPIQAFAEFVAANRRSITRPLGRELALTLSQIRASVTVEIQRGRGKDAVNGLVVRSKIQGQEKAGEVVELPDEIGLWVPLYVGSEESTIDLDLCVDADTAGAVSVLVSPGTLPEARVEAFEAMLAVVRTVAPKALSLFGRPDHAAWAYLPEIEAKRT